MFCRLLMGEAFLRDLLMPFVTVASLLLIMVTPASAGFSDAFEKYNAKQYADALAVVEPDANSGNPAAQWLLATMYLLGKGLDADPVVARGWFEKSASSNYPPSQAVLGRMYEEGIGGEQDPSEANILCRLSAEQGYADAAHLLGRQFYYGRGTAKNGPAALKWLTITTKSKPAEIARGGPSS